MSYAAISVGNQTDFRVTSENRLEINKCASPGGRTVIILDLGPATESQFDSLIEALQRLKIHAVKD